jgi:hypothetical protein
LVSDVQICLDGGANPDYTEEAGVLMAEKKLPFVLISDVVQRKTRFIPVTFLMTMSKLMPIIVHKFAL